MIIIPSRSERELDRLNIPSFRKICFREDGSKDNYNSLIFLKDLRFTAPIHYCIDDRCKYPSIFDSDYGFEDDDDEEIHGEFLRSLADSSGDVFSQLTDNTLRRFR